MRLLDLVDFDMTFLCLFFKQNYAYIIKNDKLNSAVYEDYLPQEMAVTTSS